MSKCPPLTARRSLCRVHAANSPVGLDRIVGQSRHLRRIQGWLALKRLGDPMKSHRTGLHLISASPGINRFAAAAPQRCGLFLIAFDCAGCSLAALIGTGAGVLVLKIWHSGLVRSPNIPISVAHAEAVAVILSLVLATLFLQYRHARR